MKKLCLYILCICLLGLNSMAQTWTPKANMGGSGREYAVAFSIGTKGYVTTGWDLSNVRSDLWEYDMVMNTWTQKSNLPGGARGYAVGFSINKKGYVGIGNGVSGDLNDFWEWDQVSDTWTKKTDFPGIGRINAIAFSVGNKGYIGMGNCGCSDFWEWDGDTLSPTYNTWTQRANFIGGSGTRREAVTFTIGKKGYVATGSQPLLGYKELWEWDGDTASLTFNTWAQKANFIAKGRYAAAGFAIGTKAYVGTGDDGDSLRSDFWEWDQQTDIWTQKPRFTGTARFAGIGLSIGNKGYIGTGNDWSGNYRTDFWEYCDTCPMVGVEEFNLANKVFAYPNPASTNLYIEKLKPTAEVLEIKLLDVLGKEWQAVISKEQRTLLNVSDLQEGVYFASVKTNEGVLTKKIVVQH